MSFILIFIILKTLFFVFGSFNSLNESPSDILAFAQVPPILPQNSQKSPNFQQIPSKINIEKQKILSEQKFIPLLINGKRLIDIQPNNHFIKIIANNLTKLNEILKEKKQQIHEKIKNNKEGNISSFLTTSSGREAKQLENKQEKQLEEKEEKKNKLINLNKPLILENNLNKLEEKKKLQTLNVLNNDKKEKEEREKNKKDESNNNNNKNKVKTTEKKQKFPESLPEELISIKNKKKQENEERGKEKEEKNIKVKEILKNPSEFYNKKENNFSPLNEWSFLPLLLQSVFDEFKLLNNQRNYNNILKLKTNKNILTENKNNEENKCKDVADNCEENLLFCGFGGIHQKLMEENCACTCKNYLNNKREENKTEEIEEENSEENEEEEEEKEGEDEKKEEKKEEKIDNECSDKSFRCKHWAQRGFCKNQLFQQNLKKRFCANTCNLC